MQQRVALCQSMAIHASTLVKQKEGHLQLERDLRMLVKRNPELLSVGLRQGGELIVSTGYDARFWLAHEDGMQDRQMSIPVLLDGSDWGDLAFRFQPLRRGGVMASFGGPFIPQIVFVIATCTCLFSMYLSKMFGHLESPMVVPTRVRAALDTFAEGLLVLDRNSRIVLANRAFAENVGQTNEQLRGRSVTDLPWVIPDHANPTRPWTETLRDGKARIGAFVELQLTEFTRLTYKVNSSPIAGDEEGVPQGVLTSFDDVTFHEQRKKELERTLLVLGESRERIQQQNEELRVLATQDPLTGCLNRRSFFESIDEYWQRARRNGYPIACVMVDVDHFKAVNDNYGHSFGDEVLRKVGQVLEQIVEEDGLVCRYGGEEFCITICGDGEDEAMECAERARRAIELMKLRHGSVTASLGVAAVQSFNKPFQVLLEQADRSLYVAKRRGRNRVVSWRDVHEDE
ncbi:MAG: diguanylate cyclase, partial [Dehalococcoidia bacterium]